MTYSGAGYYQGSAPAIRMDADGEYLQVFFSGAADTVQYYIRHTGLSGQDTGIFQVRESIDGNTWTLVKEYNRSLPATLTLQTVRLKESSRYVQFQLVDKVSGYNVSMDDVTIKTRQAGNKPQIALEYGSSLVNGKELRVGKVDSFHLTLKNKSTTSVLKINSAQLSGPSKADYLVLGMPDSLMPGGGALLRVFISPGAANGSLKATYTVSSNDSLSNDVFVLPFYAIKGNRATKPTDQLANLHFTQVKAWKMSVSGTGSSNFENVLILVKPGSAIGDNPEDGKVYQRGGSIGSSRILWAGPLQDVDFDKIYASTRYFVRTFTYNGYDTFLSYNTNGAAEIDSLTPGLTPGNYYNGISPADTLFLGKLKNKVRPHFQVYYSNYGSTMAENFEAYDTTGGKRVMVCTYSGYKHIYSPPIAWDTMSREHCYPYSWMGEGSKDSANYSDLHLLVPVHQNGANAVRSNFPLNNLKSVTFTFNQGKLGLDSIGNVAYEPRDEAKGFAARAAFYICATYNRPGKPFTIPTSVPFVNELQDQYVLKQWNLKYPPSTREMARMEYAASVQGNRNPFIDNPNWACYINFENMSYNASGNCGPSIAVKTATDNVKQISCYPNPGAQSQVTLDISAFEGKTGTISVYDISERLLLNTEFTEGRKVLDVSNLAPGNYLIVVRSGKEIGMTSMLRN